ncbi:MAG TPA: response regulator transcription factor [Pseudonocardia sp.]|jgi:DNA-binding response OmpR family regulator|nr:response regulator transcription factor [Pseudonocardia sp.]
MAVLVIEDEQGITDFLRRGLEAAGFSVVTAADGPHGLRTAQLEHIELVVLDLMLPGLAGEDLLARLRTMRPALPVIVLTAKDSVYDRVANLEAGADDYVVKPFNFNELLARIRARLRPLGQPSPVLLSGAGISLDVRTRLAQVGDRQVALSSREFGLLQVLLRHPGQVLATAQLREQVWGPDFDNASNVVEAYIRHLRRKLGAARIETVRGVGYRLVEP